MGSACSHPGEPQPFSLGRSETHRGQRCPSQVSPHEVRPGRSPHGWPRETWSSHWRWPRWGVVPCHALRVQWGLAREQASRQPGGQGCGHRGPGGRSGPQSVVPVWAPWKSQPPQWPQTFFPESPCHKRHCGSVQKQTGHPVSSERKTDSHSHPASVLFPDTGSRAESDLCWVSPRPLEPPPGQGHTHTSCGVSNFQKPSACGQCEPMWPRPRKPPQTPAAGGGQCHCVGILQEHQPPSRHVRATW